MFVQVCVFVCSCVWVCGAGMCVIVLCVSCCAGGMAYKYQMLLHLLTFFITDCKLIVCFVQLLFTCICLCICVLIYTPHCISNCNFNSLSVFSCATFIVLTLFVGQTN